MLLIKNIVSYEEYSLQGAVGDRMLDDSNVLRQRDTGGMLDMVAEEYQQAKLPVQVENAAYDGREITKIIVAAMGNSAFPANIIKSWLSEDIHIPFEVVSDYSLPGYVDFNTLVIASSYSGNTEEAIDCFTAAQALNAQVAIISQDGILLELARHKDIAHVALPSSLGSSRLSVLAGLRALTALLSHFSIIQYDRFAEIAETADWLHERSRTWAGSITTDQNLAKQLALTAVGSSAIFYSGSVMKPIVYRWKTSWNETAKNLAFCNVYPEFNHNELTGWMSHPVEKPFVIFDIVSDYEDERVGLRIELSDRFLSGRRPKANRIEAEGDTLLKQMLWLLILADFTSVYLAILNNIDPASLPLVDKFNQALIEVTK